MEKTNLILSDHENNFSDEDIDDQKHKAKTTD